LTAALKQVKELFKLHRIHFSNLWVDQAAEGDYSTKKLILQKVDSFLSEPQVEEKEEELHSPTKAECFLK
jgi:hypothetical protein